MTDSATDFPAESPPYASDMPRWIPFVRRRDDASDDGYLQLLREADGDVIIEVVAHNIEGLRASSIQFCAQGASPRTFRALLALAEAMAEDNLTTGEGDR